MGPIIFNMYTRPLQRIVERHKLQYHKYADDMQLYGMFNPASDHDCLRIKHQVEECLAEIRIWMLKNMLKINDSKTELIIFMNSQTKLSASASLTSIVLAGSIITSTPTVRNLGVMLDSRLEGSAQVSAIVKSCNFHLYQIARVRCYISDDACKLAILALVVSRLDYCNGLMAAATEFQLNKLQRIQNRAAKLVARPRAPRGQIVHITPILQQLHWLPVRQRIIYKLCVYVYNCLHGSGPPYLRELLHVYTRDQRLRQVSPLELTTHQPRRKVGRAGFGVTGPAVWNKLPVTLRTMDSVSLFKAHLKTHLWHFAYD